ncbi:MAG: ribosome biogenesis GTPase YlqF [Clostridia bacterium]|nr:ribosome biogenesis GTPase YlqF [Clostridia bacterium]
MSELQDLNIQWFPGHMTKTRRYIEKNISQVDIIVETVDARCIRSSQNPDFDRLLGNKKRLMIITKCDLADPAVTSAWISRFKNQGRGVVTVSLNTGKGVKEVLPAVREMLSEQIERYAAKGMKKSIRMMICGIPNSGKSTLINSLCGKKMVIAEDRPGVTRGGQWVTLSSDIQLLDTPGILWNKFDDKNTGLALAFTGAIKDDVLDVETLALHLIKNLMEKYPQSLKDRYDVEIYDGIEPLEVYEMICKRRGFVVRGGDFDYERCAKVLLDEFRGGKLGRISLEAPNA